MLEILLKELFRLVHHFSGHEEEELASFVGAKAEIVSHYLDN